MCVCVCTCVCVRSQVEYKDFPKNNKNEFVSLINCSSVPPLLSHGIGKDVGSCHDMVSRSFRPSPHPLDSVFARTGVSVIVLIRRVLSKGGV